VTAVRIAVVSPALLDRPRPESEAARALAERLAERGAEALLLGPARGAELQTEGRRAIRALERSGAIALAPTERGPRTVAVGGPVATWAMQAAVERVLRSGGVDAVAIVGDRGDDLSAVAEEAAPLARRVDVAEAVGAVAELEALAASGEAAPLPLTPREPIHADFHLHTSYSPDCATTPEELADRALELGLGALCVTDHDTVTGGYAVRAHVEAHGLPLHIAVASEVKTQTGEVIGIYLEEDIPPGLPFADTVERMREQGAFVYVPHPFDAFHATPPAPLLERMAPLIDAIEVVNGRLARERFNDEALAFAHRLGLPAGAGSDAHVAEGLFTAGLALPAFDDPASLALALGDAEVVRNPRSFLGLQVRKWVAERM
jgi:predicted metal-dependent phosphoesterase TrpH